MTAELAKARPVAVSDTAADPLYFSADAGQLFGWLHWPSGEYCSDVGLVICKPFGYEALCAHRSLRAFAHTAATGGVPTLNFDYAGTGDSTDIDPQAEQIEIWCRNIISAVTELRQRAGVRRVCLLGFRLGALLAVLAARRAPIDGLILVAPIISGKAYLRELRTSQSMAVRRAETVSIRHGSQPVMDAADGSMEIGGYLLSAATLARLNEVDMNAPGPPPASALLVLDRRGLPSAHGWVQTVSGRGVPVDYVAVPGFVEMMMTPPPFTRIPRNMIACVREWLWHFAGHAGTPVSARSLPREGTPAGGSLRPPGNVANISASSLALAERPVHFGEDRTLFGVVTEPDGHDRPRRAVVFVNAGADSHVCIGRIYVSLARRWARSGCAVLRMDLAGLGDSDTRPGRPDNEVYPPSAIEDIRAAVELMRERYDVREVVLAGLCSGAYHVLRAAAAAVPVGRILMVNPQLFFWREKARLEDIQVAELVQAPQLYRRRSRSLSHWRKLLSGHADVRRIATVVLLRALLRLKSVSRDWLRALHVRLPNDLGRELLQVAARGVDITFVFSAGEPGLELLRMESGSDLARLGPRCHIRIVAGADHTFSHRRAREALEAALSEALFAPNNAAEGSPSTCVPPR
jgi:alpha-beta hydrolase superfamily lysophospholipase